MKLTIHGGRIRVDGVWSDFKSFVDFDAHGPGGEALSRLRRPQRGSNHDR